MVILPICEELTRNIKDLIDLQTTINIQMDSGLKTISSLFDGAKKLIIPIYQRNYAWGIQEWKDFWEDVFYHSENQKYFFGTVLLKEAAKDGDFETFEIVDGQQRITTTTIFIYVLLQHLKRLNAERDLKFKEDKYIQYYGIHKLKVSELDNEFFQTYILKDEQTSIKFNTPSQRKLFDAKEYFISKLKDLPETGLNKMLAMIENAEILVYSVKNSAEATLIFETTNDRGKDLTTLEKIKSYLMYRSYLSAGENASDLIDRVHSRFGEIYRVLERIKPLFNERRIIEVSEDQICQYHYIGEYLWKNKSEYQNFLNTIKEELNRLAYENKHEQIVKYIEDYTNSLKETFLIFEVILKLNNKHLDEIIYIGKIAIFFPLLLISYKFDDTVDKKKFKDVLFALEKFSARMYAFNDYRRKDLTYFFSVTSYKFAREKDFNMVENHLINYIHDYCSKIDKTLERTNLYRLLPSRFLSYLFWKYENYLRTTFQPISNEMSFKEFNDNTGKYKISIEHITAQTPLNELVFAEQTNDFNEKYMDSVGNLTIAPQSSNSSMGNELWITKNKYYFERAPFKTQLELSSFLDQDSKKWDEIAITNRQKNLINFAFDYWATDIEKKAKNYSTIEVLTF